EPDHHTNQVAGKSDGLHQPSNFLRHLCPLLPDLGDDHHLLDQSCQTTGRRGGERECCGLSRRCKEANRERLQEKWKPVFRPQPRETIGLGARSMHSEGTYVGRVWREDVAGPALVKIEDGILYDITSRSAPTMRDLLEMDDPAAFVASATGQPLGPVPDEGATADGLRLLAPVDLQAIKACGVTFARSMIERVLGEHASGAPEPAAGTRTESGASRGEHLRNRRA